MSTKAAAQETNLSSWGRRKLYAASLRKTLPAAIKKDERKASVKRKLEEAPARPSKRLSKAPPKLLGSQKRKLDSSESHQLAKKLKPEPPKVKQEGTKGKRPGASAKPKPDHSPPPPSSSAAATNLHVPQDTDSAMEEPVAKPQPPDKPLSRIAQLRLWRKQREEEDRKKKQLAAVQDARRMTFGARPFIQRDQPPRRATLAAIRPGRQKLPGDGPVPTAKVLPAISVPLKNAVMSNTKTVTAKVTSVTHKSAEKPAPKVKVTFASSVPLKSAAKTKSSVMKAVAKAIPTAKVHPLPIKSADKPALTTKDSSVSSKSAKKPTPKLTISAKVLSVSTKSISKSATRVKESSVHVESAGKPARLTKVPVKPAPSANSTRPTVPAERAIKPGQINGPSRRSSKTSAQDNSLKKVPTKSPTLKLAKAAQQSRRATLPNLAARQTNQRNTADKRQLSKSTIAKPVTRPRKKDNQQNISLKTLPNIQEEEDKENETAPSQDCLKPQPLSTIVEAPAENESQAKPTSAAKAPKQSPIHPSSQDKPPMAPASVTKILKDPLTSSKRCTRSAKKVLFNVLDENDAEKKQAPKTPHKSLTLRGKLEAWLAQGGRSIKNHCHLRCFGSEKKTKVEETPGANLLPLHNKTLDDDSEFLEDCSLDVGASPMLKPKKTPGKRNKMEEPKLTAAYLINSLLEIKEHLKAKTLDSPAQLLAAIAQGQPEVEQLPLYWELCAMVAENMGEVSWGLELLSQAVDRGVGPFDDMAVVVERFLLRTRGLRNTPRRLPLSDHSNIILTPKEESPAATPALRKSLRLASKSTPSGF